MRFATLTPASIPASPCRGRRWVPEGYSQTSACALASKRDNAEIGGMRHPLHFTNNCIGRQLCFSSSNPIWRRSHRRPRAEHHKKALKKEDAAMRQAHKATIRKAL